MQGLAACDPAEHSDRNDAAHRAYCYQGRPHPRRILTLLTPLCSGLDHKLSFTHQKWLLQNEAHVYVMPSPTSSSSCGGRRIQLPRRCPKAYCAWPDTVSTRPVTYPRH